MAQKSKKAIGTIEWKNGKTWHSGWVTEVQQVCNPDTFIRYQTETMFGMLEPLMQVNHESNRCYFLTERSCNGDIDFAEFGRKGYTCKITLF